MREGEPVEVRIECWIMVDAACFRKMRLQYFVPAMVAFSPKLYLTRRGLCVPEQVI
jgi:hypothetical protein